MSYTTKTGVHVDTKDIVLFAATLAVAGAVNGETFDVGNYNCACLDLDVTALTASDTLDAKIQTSKDGTTWRDVATFLQKTTVGTERKSFPGLDRYVRAVVTPTDAGGGGMSATVKISGELK